MHYLLDFGTCRRERLGIKWCRIQHVLSTNKFSVMDTANSLFDAKQMEMTCSEVSQLFLIISEPRMGIQVNVRNLSQRNK